MVTMAIRSKGPTLPTHIFLSMMKYVIHDCPWQINIS